MPEFVVLIFFIECTVWSRLSRARQKLKALLADAQ